MQVNRCLSAQDQADLPSFREKACVWWPDIPMLIGGLCKVHAPVGKSCETGKRWICEDGITGSRRKNPQKVTHSSRGRLHDTFNNNNKISARYDLRSIPPRLLEYVHPVGHVIKERKAATHS
jgi:hypothetical protein